MRRYLEEIQIKEYIFPLDFRGLPSLKTIFGRQDMENDAAASNVGSSCFPTSVRVYSIRTGDSETIFLFIISNF